MRQWRRLMGMKQILVMIAVVVLVGCGTTKVDPNFPANIDDPIVEKEVREKLKKPTEELTEADLARIEGVSWRVTRKINDERLKDVAKLQKLKRLYLFNTRITDEGLKEVAKLQNLEFLNLNFTQITDEGLEEVAKLQNLMELGLNGTKTIKW